jgi:hypothetical protein
MTDLTIEQRVEAGAAWLDASRPGWLDRIDLDELRMDYCDACILGQIFGDYWDAPLADHIPPYGEEMDKYEAKAAQLGFQSVDQRTGSTAELSELGAEWRALIEGRRAGAAVPA